MISVVGQIHERGTRLVFADVDDGVRSVLDRFGITELVGPDAYFDSLVEATEAFSASLSERPDDE